MKSSPPGTASRHLRDGGLSINKEKRMKIRIMPLIVFVLLVTACAAPSTPQPIDTIAPTIEATSTPEATLPPAQTEPSPTTESAPAITMATYTDDFAGFSIDYPADWFLEASALTHAQESFAYSVSVASWDILHPPAPTDKDPDKLPSGGAKIDVNVVKQSMTLEEAVTQQGQDELGTPILARKDVTLANGLPAVMLDFEGFAGPIRTLITVLNGNVIYVSGYGNLENFESIALTLRAR
jgi:hypothetical protein